MQRLRVNALVDFQALKTTDLGAEREPPENNAKVRQPIQIRPKSLCRLIMYILNVSPYMFTWSFFSILDEDIAYCWNNNDSIFSLRSIHRLTQLERLDLGSNEFSDVVRLLSVII